MKAIFVRPSFDEASQFSYLWCQRLIDAVKDKLEQCIDLAGNQATRNNTEDALNANPDAAFVFYDHGDEQGLVAQNAEGYVIDKENDHLLKGRVAYSLACLWASDGGVDAWRKGAKVVVGYIKAFAFTNNGERLFCEAANSGFIAYVNGENDWKKIKNLMIEAFNKAIEQATDPWTQLWLTWDRDALRIYAEDVDVPESKCVLRTIAIKTLGPKLGWKISRKHALSLLLLGAGCGVYLHDRVAEWVTLGCRLHGLDVGFALVFIAWVLISFELIKWFKMYS